MTMKFTKLFAAIGLTVAAMTVTAPAQADPGDNGRRWDNNRHDARWDHDRRGHNDRHWHNDRRWRDHRHCWIERRHHHNVRVCR